MIVSKKNKIIKLATAARKDISKVYHGNTKTLGGACGVASWHLMSLLQKNNINAKYCYCIGHYWVEVDNLVIDITATQFAYKNYPKVLILNKEQYLMLPFVYSQQINEISCTKKAFEEMSGWTWCVDTKDFATLKRLQKSIL